MGKLTHVLSGLEIGGKERIAVQLATRGRREGLDHRLLLFDAPYRGEEVDFDPGEVPVEHLRRGVGMDWLFALRLARYCRREGIAVLHAHNDTAVFYCALAKCLRLGRGPRVVGTFHARPGHDTEAARRLTRWASGRVDAVTAVSPDLAAYLQEAGWVHRCQTLWNGVDREEFSPEGPDGGWRAQLGVPREAFLIAHIGRFHKVKRQRDLVDAARIVAAARDDVRVVFVGQGPTTDEVRERAADLAETVRFAPRVVDVAAFLREIDLFVICSEQECAPRVVLEAMACARPILATDVGGIREMMTDLNGEVCGRLVPPARPEELASAILEMVDDKDARSRWGRLALSRVADFSHDREWDEYASLYRPP
jgi:glycosyltransferase involved in cell wall biosynthesis